MEHTRQSQEKGKFVSWRASKILTCTFHRQFQSFFDHQWWDRQC